MIQLPAILDIPVKLLPFVKDFNKYRFFLMHGGRGGGKTYAIARFLCYLAEKNKVRVVCGREIQSSIKDSVYTVFVDTIKQFNLTGFTIKSQEIIHENGSEIKFKGFREQGIVSSKGLEGVDILWIDEAEAITKNTIDIVIPTIRKPNSKVIFSMNRKTRQDAVYTQFSVDNDCQVIQINYNDNQFCPQELKNEALKCKDRNEDEYNHIWLGQPLAQNENTVFNTNDLDKCKLVEFFGNKSTKGRVLSVDVAGGSQGADLNVATIIDTISPTRFNTDSIEAWAGHNTMQTTGRIVDLVSKYEPNVVVVDATGIGEGVYDRLLELGVDVIDFKGARQSERIDCYNTRAESYFKTAEMIEKGYINLNDDRVINDLEVMKYKFMSGGSKIILPKNEIKKVIQRSPDFADSFTMAVWALDKIDYSADNEYLPEYY